MRDSKITATGQILIFFSNFDGITSMSQKIRRGDTDYREALDGVTPNPTGSD